MTVAIATQQFVCIEPGCFRTKKGKAVLVLAIANRNAWGLCPIVNVTHANNKQQQATTNASEKKNKYHNEHSNKLAIHPRRRYRTSTLQTLYSKATQKSCFEIV